MGEVLWQRRHPKEIAPTLNKLEPQKVKALKRKNLMRIFVVLICSLGLVSGAHGAQQEENKQKKKQPQTVQHAPPSTTGHATGAGAGPKKTSMGAYEGKKGQTSMGAYEGQKGKVGKGGKVTGATAATGKAPKAQHFDLPKQPNTAKAPPVKFQQGKRIEGSQNWQGQQYTVFRNYRSEWHDQNWWHSRYHNNIVFVFGAPYYWNAGYWFPAWGYSPNAYYAWDGPIYGYNHLPPDQVIANAQAALQQQGYYHGEADGLIGPLTREALANYQRDHGLYETASIDQPTLE